MSALAPCLQVFILTVAVAVVFVGALIWFLHSDPSSAELTVHYIDPLNDDPASEA